jgi:glutathione peroxidase
MKKLLIMGLLSSLTSCFVGKSKKIENSNAISPNKSIHEYSINNIDGKSTINFSDFKGKYILIVNTASECGYTPQYKLLEEFYNNYKSKNVVVLGFPCNQFGGQEPGTSEQIINFCSTKYNITFPMTEKIDVKGENQHPIYKWLCNKSMNGASDFEVKWNFNKFVINPEGKLTHYFGSGTSPKDSAFVEAFRDAK